MSLLMQALANAEAHKRQITQQSEPDESEAQEAAANIFNAAQTNRSAFSIIVNALIVLILIGIAWFSYKLYQLNQIPDNIPLATTTNATDVPPEPANIDADISTTPQTPVETKAKPKTAAVKGQLISNHSKQATNQKTQKQTKLSRNKTIDKNHEGLQKAVLSDDVKAAQTYVLEPNAQDKQRHVQQRQAQANAIDAIKIERKPGELISDETLQQAYLAFKSGEYNDANRLYKAVLQDDILQTDALLGMAAIAQKESRFADAAGWYRRALHSEPNNPLALAGLAATKPMLNINSQEQRLKKLISQQPYHAQHYANLGNFYASQQAWGKAQAAFFEANNHDKQNAQFAFNLAISLEHLGKPSLAATHYQRALRLVNDQKLSVPNAEQIQQRLRVLQ